jgi:hypothetical protein
VCRISRIWLASGERQLVRSEEELKHDLAQLERKPQHRRAVRRRRRARSRSRPSGRDSPAGLEGYPLAGPGGSFRRLGRRTWHRGNLWHPSGAVERFARHDRDDHRPQYRLRGEGAPRLFKLNMIALGLTLGLMADGIIAIAVKGSRGSPLPTVRGEVPVAVARGYTVSALCRGATAKASCRGGTGRQSPDRS